MTTPVHEQINYWAGVKGHPLGSFERMKVARPFRYSVTEKKLYRELKPILFGPIYGYVEIDLNLNVRGPSHFDFDLLIHNRSADRSDKFLTDAPVHYRHAITGLHGHEVAQAVLYGDLWSQLDYNKLHYLNSRAIGVRRIRLADVLQPGGIAEQLT